VSVTPYRAVSFEKNDVITRGSLDQLQSNLQWINDNAPRGRFVRINDEPLDVRTVLIGGKVHFPARNAAMALSKKISFPKGSGSTKDGVFNPSCRPHITTGIISDFQRRIFCAVTGPNDNNYPDGTGFRIRVYIAAEKQKNKKIQKDFFVCWQAMGWRKVGT